MNRFLCALCLLSIILMMAAVTWADEEDIPVDKLPKAVVDAIHAKYQNAKLVGAEKETQADKTFYEVNIKHEDRTIELLLTPEGKIVVVEQPIAIKDLPKAVTEAVEKQYPKGTVKNADETIRERKATYAVLLEDVVMIGKEKQKVHLLFDAAGKVHELQKLIGIKDLPQAVTTALDKKYPKSRITRANQVSKENQTSYIVALESDDQRILAVMDAEGTIIREASQKK